MLVCPLLRQGNRLACEEECIYCREGADFPKAAATCFCDRLLFLARLVVLWASETNFLFEFAFVAGKDDAKGRGDRHVAVGIPWAWTELRMHERRWRTMDGRALDEGHRLVWPFCTRMRGIYSTSAGRFEERGSRSVDGMHEMIGSRFIAGRIRRWGRSSVHVAFEPMTI